MIFGKGYPVLYLMCPKPDEMKQIFALFICGVVGGLSAQNAAWNPDANGDGAVGSADLLAFLTAYGESFVPPAAEDENWVECTAEDYVLLSDTFFSHGAYFVDALFV